MSRFKLADASRYGFEHGGVLTKILWMIAPNYMERRYMRKLINEAYWDRLLFLMREHVAREQRRRVMPEDVQ